MKTKLLFIWEVLQTSFWFLPLSIILVAIGGSLGLVYLDTQFSYSPQGIIGYFFSGGVDSARNILSTIAGAMLGVASTVFSITLVALTLASSQFGSRLLRNFMHDRLNQVVLGTYIATFTYCLLVLRTVKSSNGIEFVPNISVLVAIFIAIGNIFLLVIFIHHISMNIQADQVISDISKKLSKSINHLFPDELGEENDEENEKIFQRGLNEKKSQHMVISNASGYLQAIDNDGLITCASVNDLILELHFRPGDFLVEKEKLATVNSAKKVKPEILDEIRNAFILGNKRTPLQDAEFAIHQVVEIASRALSPGVNDPYTAITCIDKLTETMCFLTRVSFPLAFRFDSNENIRVLTQPLTFNGMMDAAFHQIRQYGKDSPSILIRLMDSFIKLGFFVQTTNQKNALQKHASMVISTAKKVDFHPNDMADLEERYNKLNVV